MDDQPVIRVRGLVNRFGHQIVHDGLDLEVRSNEIFGIVGGSGTGKSVLLRTILGLQVPDAGTVSVRFMPATLAATHRSVRRQMIEYRPCSPPTRSS